MISNNGYVIKVRQDRFFLESAGSGQSVGSQWAGSGQAVGRQWAGSGQAVVKVSQSKSTIKVRQVGFFQM